MIFNPGNFDPKKRIRGKDESVVEIGTLKKIFEKKPANSTVICLFKCSGCGNDMLIDVTHTSEGFGLNGGFIFEFAPEKYFIKCCNCHRLNNKTPGS